jgi:hypothetical protein
LPDKLRHAPAGMFHQHSATDSGALGGQPVHFPHFRRCQNFHSWELMEDETPSKNTNAGFAHLSQK